MKKNGGMFAGKKLREWDSFLTSCWESVVATPAVRGRWSTGIIWYFVFV